MRIIYYLLLVCLVLISSVANGQYVIPEITLGRGNYSMKDLKEFQSTLLSGYPVALKSVNSFPSYFFFKACLFYDISHYRFGISWGHYSTGGRNHYRDYSGEISVKQRIHTDVFSWPFYLKLHEERRFNFYLSFEPGIMCTKYEVLEEIEILDEYARYDYSDVTNSLSLQTGLTCSYIICRWQPSIQFGYFFDTKFTVESDFPNITIRKDNSKYSDFSGIRFSVSLAYRIL